MKKISIVATSPEHLRALVIEAIAEHGPACDLNHLDVSGLTNMAGIFQDLPFNGDISGWDTGRVENMACLFQDSAFAGDISQWNTSSLRNTTRMFKNSVFNGDLQAWNMRKCRSLIGMFQNAAFDGSIESWGLCGDLRLDSMFSHGAFKGDLSRLNISKNSSCENMLSTSFEGVLPRAEDLRTCRTTYNSLFGDASRLWDYLARTPFSGVHADLLIIANKRPVWATTVQHKWVKEQRSLGQAIGLDPQELRAVIASQGQVHFAGASPLVQDISFAFEMPGQDA